MSSAQQRDTVSSGLVTGVVWDSLHNYVLPSATIAVYTEPGTNLISYQLSNNMGEFNFKNLPLGQQLTIIVSHSGYTPQTINFTIPSKTKQTHFKNLNMQRSVKQLETVIVKSIPPVRMNGDTLEFNADAFKLDSNAVVEDLMRKLPGVTIWSDGMITVNGRKINNLFVEGKPFFGDDPKIAMQNLPKTSVDKIQVYQHQKNDQHPMDSVTDVNIKLKKDKKRGAFGKIGVGYGTDKRYEADVSLNAFSPRDQIALIGASNNVNKQANDINTLQRNASFKGVGASIEYLPDFRAQGRTTQHAGGVSYRHDFVDGGNEYDLKNTIIGSYYLRNNNNKLQKDNRSITYLGTEEKLIQQSNIDYVTNGTNQKFDSKYNWIKDRKELYISPSIRLDHTDDNINTRSISSAGSGDIQSSGSNITQLNKNASNMLLEAGYKTNMQKDRKSRGIGGFKIDYKFWADENKSTQTRKSEFVSAKDQSLNASYNRSYNERTNFIGQEISIKAADLNRLFSKPSNLTGLQFAIYHQHALKVTKDNSLVQEMDTTTNLYKINRYLTNESKYGIHSEATTVRIGKLFSNELANRFQKNVLIELTPRVQYFNQKNISKKTFQNFDINYWNFLPGASISFNNNQFGRFQANYALTYSTSIIYPAVDQLTPLVDSSIIWYLQLGNMDLRPAYKQEVQLSVMHNSLKRRNIFFYHLTLRGGKTEHLIVDSSVYDNQGRSVHYPVNANGNKYLNINGTISKAFRYKEHQFQVNFAPSFGIATSPVFVDNFLYLSNDMSTNAAVRLAYTKDDWLAVNLDQSFSWYQSEQKDNAIENRFRSTDQLTGLSASCRWPKRVTASTNINYRRVKSDISTPIRFAIWNANISYRFFKGNNAEVKFSAFDLLRQNKTVINSGSNNMLNREIVNMLQQYYMLTIAWYPRMFNTRKGQ